MEIAVLEIKHLLKENQNPEGNDEIEKLIFEKEFPPGAEKMILMLIEKIVSRDQVEIWQNLLDGVQAIVIEVHK